MQLPAVDDTLVTADGKELKPVIRSIASVFEMPSNTQAQRIVASTRRKLVEMPGTPKEMNAFSAVFIYTASGLSDDEISVATKLPRDQIVAIRNTKAYSRIEEMVAEAVNAAVGSEVTRILANGEVAAANRLVELVESDDSKVAIKAVDSLLDRRGHKPKDQVKLEVDLMSTFRIEVVDRTTAATPTIDLEAE